MRIVLALITAFSSLLMWSNAAVSLENKELYKVCKSYADNGFQYRNDFAFGYCAGFFLATANISRDLCFSGTLTNDPSLKRIGVGGKGISLETAIQIYVNKMQKHPEKWGQKAHGDVLLALQDLSPCE